LIYFNIKLIIRNIEYKVAVMMIDKDALVVREIELFSSLSDEHFDDLLQMSYLQRFPSQQQLLTKGDPADFLHVLIEGSVELFSHSSDREATMVVLGPMSVYNLSGILEDSVYLMSARTLDAARILIIPAVNIHRVMRINTGFAYEMARELAKRYRLVLSAFEEHRLFSGIERLAIYLLRANEKASRSGQIELTQNKRQLAALLGITPEYLSRAFNLLKEYGVEVRGAKVSLSNLDALNHFVKPGPLVYTN
jgi:CRP/FNR family transcriptional activator FtrB